MPKPETCPEPLCILDIPDPSACNDCPSIPPPHNPAWGGKRSGAGAPQGNLNRLKHGRRSRLIERAVEKICQDPDLLAVLYLISALAESDSLPPETKEVVLRIINRTGDILKHRTNVLIERGKKCLS